MYDGLSEDELARMLRVPNVVCLATAGSTLDIVHELGGDGAENLTVVLADQQLSGRGRHGRSWISPRGLGIWLGVLVYPRQVSSPGVIAIRVGLHLAQALDELGAGAELKWPNDIMLKNRKLAGILCEARWDGETLRWMAVGVGINVHEPLPDEVRSSAIALEEVLPKVSRSIVLECFIPRMLQLDEAPELTAGELQAYYERDWLRHRPIIEPVCGRVEGIEADGALAVATDDGLERVLGGTVVTA